MTMQMSIDRLPVDVLLNICEYLSIYDLCNLSSTCTTLMNLITNSNYIGSKLLVTNQATQLMRDRSIKLLSTKEKLFLSRNWQLARYKETSLIYMQRRCMPWINLTKQYLLISIGKEIQVYNRCNSDNYLKKVYNLNFPADVAKFSYKPDVIKDYIVGGYVKGIVAVWKIESGIFWEIQAPDLSDINSVDIGNNEVFASGSKDGKIQVISFQQKQVIHTVDLDDRIWSLAYSRNAHKLAVGTDKYKPTPAVTVFDTERCAVAHELGRDLLKGSGMLDIRWLNPNVLLSAGYDTCIRKWDLRTGTCVQYWEDPYYSTVYCLDTDYAYTILSGTESHGRAVLWDMRKKGCVQIYFMKCCKKQRFSSPVYSLAFDVNQFYAATDKNLTVIDFSFSNMPSKDYSWILAD